MTTSVTFQVPATEQQIKEIQESGGYREVEIEQGEEVCGVETVYVTCYDPDYGYWAQNFASELREKLPSISICSFCGYKWIEQPHEDADKCPSCGEEFSDYD